MTVMDRLEQKVGENKVTPLVSGVINSCKVTRSQVLGVDPMPLAKQVEVTTFIYNQAGCLVDYGETELEPLDEETKATVYTELYGNAVPTGRRTEYSEEVEERYTEIGTKKLHKTWR